jgi:hypothetical protein
MGTRSLDIEDKKLEIFRKKVEIQAAQFQVAQKPEDNDLLFLKSLLPEVKKAKNKRKLKRKLLEVVDEYLEAEEFMTEHFTTP